MKRITMLLAGCMAWAAAAGAFAQEAEPAPEVQRDVVLLVAPARYNVMQVAFDVANRYSTVLVSFQGKAESPKLHAWNGMEWLPLSLADFQSGAFLGYNLPKGVEYDFPSFRMTLVFATRPKAFFSAGEDYALFKVTRKND